MFRRLFLASLLLPGACALAGCGQKGPLTLPPARPAAHAGAASNRHAPAAAAPARAASSAGPAGTGNAR